MSAAVVAWRITSHERAESAFDGEGARRYDGRWNSEGVPMIYLAGSLAPAALEQLAHLSRAELLVGQFVRFRVCIPEEALLALDEDVLPTHWTEEPEVTQALGDGWVEAEDSMALRVPSALVPEEANYLLNMRHPDADTTEIGPPEPFVFDRRLVESDA